MARYRSYDHISIREQAARAADHYRKLGPRPIPVFPCKRTGHSVDFRSALAAELVGGFYTGREYNEARCAELGFPFVEVDPTDYK